MWWQDSLLILTYQVSPYQGYSKLVHKKQKLPFFASNYVSGHCMNIQVFMRYDFSPCGGWYSGDCWILSRIYHNNMGTSLHVSPCASCNYASIQSVCHKLRTYTDLRGHLQSASERKRQVCQSKIAVCELCVNVVVNLANHWRSPRNDCI